jgi:hypothetical protein
VPKRNIRAAAICSLFDHPVGNGEQPWRDAEAECLGGVEVDHELELRRLLEWQIRGLGPFEDLTGVVMKSQFSDGYLEIGSVRASVFGRAPVWFDRIRTIRD